MSQVDPSVPPSGTGCADCDATGGWWFHLRRCAACGHVGCCDSSPSQHASAHATGTGHRFAQSFEPGEDWTWDYAAGEFGGDLRLAPPTSRPVGQPAPGPAGRVPADWQRHLHH
ncbi:UBP-type zinc finger domain-containing protein [Geodermatophilus sp. SYSU D01180]